MTTRIDSPENLFDWFHAQVTDARAQTSLKISNETEIYLTQLLVERARSDRPAPAETTLAELHARAANAPPAEQIRVYRELGDRSLYILGWFRESLDRKIVGPAYYADMGASAYHRVDQGFKRWFSDAFGSVFAELAAGYRDCVQVLRLVRRANESEDDALMRNYRNWLADRGARALPLPRPGTA